MLKVKYEELRPEEFVEIINSKPIAYLPLGTLEWHSLHLPLGTDALVAEETFIRIAKRVGGIVLPPLFLGPDLKQTKDNVDYYGMEVCSFEDNHPQMLQGNSYWIDDELYKNILDSIIRNLKRTGFKIIVANGHGPSTNQFEEYENEFKEKYEIELYTMKQLGYNGYNGITMDHAASLETALSLAFHEHLVKMDNLKDKDPMISVWGKNPRDKTKEDGNKIIEEAVVTISNNLERILKNIKPDNRNLDYTNIKDLT